MILDMYLVPGFSELFKEDD